MRRSAHSTLPGKPLLAEPRAEQAASDAKRTSFRPIEAEALEALGRTQILTGKVKAAKTTLLYAFAAAQAGRDDRAAAGALVMLTALVGEKLGHPEKGLVWAKQARAMLERMGGDELLSARLLVAKGDLVWRSGDSKRAADEYARAIAIRERVLGPESPEVGAALADYGWVLTDIGRYEEARRALERSLEIRTKALGPEHPDVASSLNALGTFELDRGPLAHFHRAAELYARAYGPEHPAVSAALSNEVVALTRLGRAAEALPIAERVLEIDEKTLGTQTPNYATALMSYGSAQLTKRFRRSTAPRRSSPVPRKTPIARRRGSSRVARSSGSSATATPAI